MTWAESVKREFTERIQFTRNVGKNARMRSQCVPGSLKLQKSLGTRLTLYVHALRVSNPRATTCSTTEKFHK